MNRKCEIAYFPGSFNPIHMGHLMLATYIVEFLPIDRVLFGVTPQNPLKRSEDLLDDNLRLEMVRLALADYEKFDLTDLEFYLPRPSYTIDSLRKLSSDHNDCNFSLIMGADNWKVIESWKEPQQIIDCYKILIYPRLGMEISTEKLLPESVQLVNAPIIEISSTFIRDSIRDGRSLPAFLPPKVNDFIEKHQLYRSR